MARRALMKKIFISVFIFAIAISVQILSVHAGEGDLIIKFKSSMNTQDEGSVLSSLEINKQKELLSGTNIYLAKPGMRVLSTQGLMKMISEDPNVEWVQEDHPVSQREVLPNDPMFKDLWSLKSDNGSDISATEAWEYGTGKKNRRDNNIAVAIIDGGFDLKHKDLVDNIWVNPNEIPDNKIDDDNNGYVDDVNGWNAYRDNGVISSSFHGTHVAGIVGAKGNNELQVAGVNWDINIVPISGSSGHTSTVLKAYDYALNLKKRWLETDGKEGLNVVSTNSSFGIDYANCEGKTYPAWNKMYDEMGKYGILSAAATINNAINVDERGDVPTACSSDYIVAVTNTTKENTIYNRAGYGAKSIDLGAPGTNIMSLAPGDNARTATGTSMATPHVAGAIGFLYGVASDRFVKEYKANPGKMALKIKEILLSTTDPLETLKGKTVSGGKLNLYKAAQKIAEY